MNKPASSTKNVLQPWKHFLQFVMIRFLFKVILKDKSELKPHSLVPLSKLLPTRLIWISSQIQLLIKMLTLKYDKWKASHTTKKKCFLLVFSLSRYVIRSWYVGGTKHKTFVFYSIGSGGSGKLQSCLSALMDKDKRFTDCLLAISLLDECIVQVIYLQKCLDWKLQLSWLA